MRNIDEDPILLHSARRHHRGEATREQLHWTLGERGYSKEEVEAALNDFHWIHVHAPGIVEDWLLPACILCPILLLILKALP